MTQDATTAEGVETSAPMGALMLAALTGTMAMMAFVAIVGPLVRRLELPEWVAGLSVTTGGLLWMLLARWWGGMGDRHGRKPVLVVGFAAFALVYLALAYGIDLALRRDITAAAALVLLIVARGLVGAFYAAVPPTAAAVVATRGFEVSAWAGLFAPAAIPGELRRMISADVSQALAAPEVVAAYKTLGYEAPNLSPPQFDALIRRETAQWAKVVQAAHLKLD